MKLKTRFSLCTKPVTAATDDNDDHFPAAKTTATSSTSSSPASISSNITSDSSLLSHSSLQTLPSVPSLQTLSLLDYTVTLTSSLSSSLTLPSAINSLSLSSSSSNLLYAASGHHIHVYDPTTFTHLETFTSTPSTGAVKSIAFCGEKILTAHQDGKIRVWKVKEEKQNRRHKLVATLPTLSDRAVRFVMPKNHVKVRRHKTRLWVEHHDAVSCLAVKNSDVYSVSWDRTLKVWGQKDMRCQESVTVHEDAVNAVTVSNDGMVYTGSAEGRIKVWSRGSFGGSGKHGLVATLEKHKSAVNALALSEDGSILFSGACDRSILVWEREDSGKYMVVSGGLRGHGGAILCLVNITEFLISGSADRTVRIWRRGGEGKFGCLAVLTGHSKAVKSLAARMECEDGIITVISGGLDGEIKVWRVKVNSCHQ